MAELAVTNTTHLLGNQWDNAHDGIRMMMDVEELRLAGFTKLQTDGLDQGLLDNALCTTRKFFERAAVDADFRDSATSKDDPARRGFSASLTENFASLYGTRGDNDLVCKFRIGPEPEKDKSKAVDDRGSNVKEDMKEAAGKVGVKVKVGQSSTTNKCSADGSERPKNGGHLLRKNSWPPTQPEFRSAVWPIYEYFEDMSRQCVDQLDKAFFKDNSRPIAEGFKHRHTNILSVNWYCLTEEERSERIECIHRHTDVSLFTLIIVEPDECGKGKTGLLVEDRTNSGGNDNDSVLKPLAPNQGEAILLVGDLLNYWTDGQLKSTVHAVCTPEKSRISYVYFVSPAPEAVVRDTTYEKWRKKRIKQAMRALKKR